LGAPRPTLSAKHLFAALISYNEAIMIDIRHLRANPDEYKRSAERRAIKVDIDELLTLDAQRTALIGQVEELRAHLNVKGKPTEDQLRQLQDAKTKRSSVLSPTCWPRVLRTVGRRPTLRKKLGGRPIKPMPKTT
jgi:hypothetical protein